MDLLRFSTAGSVDDGKSTLIGRLLYDSKGVFEDQLDAVRRASRNETAGEVDLSLLTDGLRAEREQGITIDVAYRYFATPKRKFIIADTPGHEQYTRNMATGASTAEASVILIDARKGVQPQSRRHAFIAQLLGIRHLVVAVNKMDLVDYDESVFHAIVDEFRGFLGKLGRTEMTALPVSALVGDNVVGRSERMPWYSGPSLLEHLESIDVSADENLNDFRYPVQLVLRPNADFRAYAGEIASGIVKPGDPITVFPSGRTTTVKRIHTASGALGEAFAPMSVAIQLEDEIDVSRGDLLVRTGNEPNIANELNADLVWMGETPLDPRRPYLIKHNTRSVRVHVDTIQYRVDVNTLEQVAADRLALNEIGRVHLSCAEPLAFDPYSRNRRTGSFVVIDLETNNTVAAGMICDQQPASSHRQLWPATQVDRAAREAINQHRGGVLWLTGLPGAGKADIAGELEQQLFRSGISVYRIDGAHLRDGLSSDLGFSVEDRNEHLRRAAEVARVLVDAGHLVIAGFVSPLRAQRKTARQIIGDRDFVEVYVAAPDSREPRDPLGHYLKAKAEEGADAIDVPYEVPAHSDLTIELERDTTEAAVRRIIDLLQQRGVLHRRNIH